MCIPWRVEVTNFWLKWLILGGLNGLALVWKWRVEETCWNEGCVEGGHPFSFNPPFILHANRCNCNELPADLSKVHLAFQTLVGYFAVYQFLLSDRFRFTRNHLENLLPENTAYFYGFCLFLIFPGMILVQNFLISLFMNMNRTKLTLKSILRHLVEVSQTNFTLFSEIHIFSFQEKKAKDFHLPRMICSYLSMCLLPMITCTLIAYPFYDFTICSARARFWSTFLRKILRRVELRATPHRS